MKAIKKVITYQIRTLYYLESISWLKTLYLSLHRGRQYLVGFVIGFIFLSCLYIIKPFKFVKLYNICCVRIGSLAGDMDLFLRRLQLGIIRKEGIWYVGIANSTPCNKQLLKMFKRKLLIIQIPRVIHILLGDILTKEPILGKSGFYQPLPFNLNEYYEFNNTEPNLYFTTSEEDEGEKLLNKIGINDNSWFACFHSRDPAYLSSQFKFTDWSYDHYRNPDVKNYLEAAKYIASCGGYAVRVGYGVSEKLPDLNNPRIIDYASYHRTDFGDIYLPAKCKFFLGSESGLYQVSTTFHIPVALANWVHLEYTPFRKGDLFITQKIWSTEKKRFLTFREILESEARRYGSSKQYAEAGLEVVENTAGEILEVAKEMNERLDGNFEYTEEDEELQNRFRSLFQPHHCSYGSPARIGAEFLRQNRELLD